MKVSRGKLMHRTWVMALLVLVSGCLHVSLYALDVGSVQIHGTFSQGYLESHKNNYIDESSDGTFDFREYGLNATYAKDRWKFGGQVFGREYGAVGNDDIFLDWLSVDYAWRDWMGIRAGKLKVPYGFYGATRDIDSLRTELLLPQGVYIEYTRGIFNAAWGGELYGYVPFDNAGGLSYQLQYGIRDIDDGNGEMENLLTRSGSTLNKIEEEDSCAAALTWHTPLEGLRAGTTFSWSEFDFDGNITVPFGSGYDCEVEDFMMWIASVEYACGPMTLASEVMFGSLDAEYEYASPVLPNTDYSSDYWGWYLKGDYYLVAPLALGVGYSFFEFDQIIDNGPFGKTTAEEDSNDVFLSLRWDITQALTFKAEQHFVDGVAGVFQSENPQGVEEDWSMFIFKLSYAF